MVAGKTGMASGAEKAGHITSGVRMQTEDGTWGQMVKHQVPPMVFHFHYHTSPSIQPS